MNSKKWDIYYLKAALLASTMSKDPSTKVGAVLVDDKSRPVSTGCNGFPRGADDSAEKFADRENKLKHIIHAEKNCILNAGRFVDNCTMYLTHSPCSQCMAFMKQAGIIRVVWIDPSDMFKQRWGEYPEYTYGLECQVYKREDIK